MVHIGTVYENTQGRNVFGGKSMIKRNEYAEEKI
jgi:hypothetical protein